MILMGRWDLEAQALNINFKMCSIKLSGVHFTIKGNLFKWYYKNIF